MPRERICPRRGRSPRTCAQGQPECGRRTCGLDLPRPNDEENPPAIDLVPRDAPIIPACPMEKRKERNQGGCHKIAQYLGRELVADQFPAFCSLSNLAAGGNSAAATISAGARSSRARCRPSTSFAMTLEPRSS